MKFIHIFSALFPYAFGLNFAHALTSFGGSEFDLITPLPLDSRLNYEFSGSTVLSRKHVTLTGDAKDRRGRIVSKSEAALPDNFVFTMDFKLEGEGSTLYGDGMVLAFTDEDPGTGAMMGLNEYYRGAAILIDTYRNGKAGRIFPRMILAQNDGSMPYDKDNDGKANELDSCGLRGIHNNKRQEYSKIRVSYSRTLGKVAVDVDFRNKWETCAVADISLGALSKISVSAATGDLTDGHIIKDLRLVDHGASIPAELVDSRPKTAKEKNSSDEVESGSTFFGFIKFIFVLTFKLLMAAGILWGGFRGWKEYKMYQRRREDNLYKLT